MKKLIVALAATAALTVACNKEEHKDSNLHITGTIKGLKQGKLYIQQLKDTALVALDTIVINGKSDFESYLKIDSPEMLYLFLDRGQTNSVDNNLPFFAEPGEMKIETGNEQFFANAKITGSENQKAYEDYLKIKSRFTSQNLDLVKKSIEATKDGNVAVLDSVRASQDRLMARRYLYTVNFALSHSNKEIAPYLALAEIYDIKNVKYLDTIAKSMTPKVAKSLYGKELKAYIAERKKAQETPAQ